MRSERSIVSRRHLPAFLPLVLAMLAACTPVTPAATPTPDPCAPEQRAEQVKELHSLTREFDDAADVATNTDLRGLYAPIAELQRIRGEVEDHAVPACLETLRESQLAFMGKTVDALAAFAGGTADVNTLAQGLTDARKLRDQYNLEFAAAMGLPVAAATPTSAP